jgi:hypothetical protein
LINAAETEHRCQLLCQVYSEQTFSSDFILIFAEVRKHGSPPPNLPLNVDLELFKPPSGIERSERSGAVERLELAGSQAANTPLDITGRGMIACNVRCSSIEH